MTVGRVAREAYREALPILLASSAAGLLAGVVLGGMRSELRALPGLLVLVPALLATRGNVYGVLGARLATALHQGLVEPAAPASAAAVRAAVAAALAAGLLASSAAALLAAAALAVLAREAASPAALLAVAAVSAVLSGVVLATVVTGAVVVGYRRGVNPDTIVGPVVTTTGDVVGIAALLVAVRLVVALGGG